MSSRRAATAAEGAAVGGGRSSVTASAVAASRTLSSSRTDKGTTASKSAATNGSGGRRGRATRLERTLYASVVSAACVFFLLGRFARDDARDFGTGVGGWGIRSSRARRGASETSQERDIAACLLIKDENNRLPEWLAYHYAVLPLRHLVVAVDPTSVSSPMEIFRQWNESSDMNMEIMVWGDEQIFGSVKALPLDHPKTTEVYIHRQGFFLKKCLHYHKRSNRTWVLLTDPDEYIVYNRAHEGEQVFPKARSEPANDEERTLLRSRRALPDVGDVTIADFLHRRQNELPWSEVTRYPCFVMPRLLFGPGESLASNDVEARRDGVPVGFDHQKFDTLRFVEHAKKGGPIVNSWGKPLVNVAMVDELPKFVRTPHNPLAKKFNDTTDCWDGTRRFEEKGGFRPLGDYLTSPLRVQHYVGSWESFSAKSDVHRTREMFEARKVSFGKNYDIKPWLDRFVRNVGYDRAKELLESAGVVDYWKDPLDKDVGRGSESPPPPADASAATPKDCARMPPAVPKKADAMRGTSSSLPTDATKVPEHDIAACLLLKDENHRLPEWLAYHYATLPLRHLAVAVDPNSVSCPNEILNKWNDSGIGMHITLWGDEDVFGRNRALPMNHSHFHIVYLRRQSRFLGKCLKYHRSKGRTWVLLTDPDEYLVYNKPIVGEEATKAAQNSEEKSKIQERIALPNVGDVTFADYIKRRKEAPPWNNTVAKPCFVMPRLLFGPGEAMDDVLNEGVPEGFNPTKFDTLRFFGHGDLTEQQNKFGKALVNVATAPHIPWFVANPHNPYLRWDLCWDGTSNYHNMTDFKPFGDHRTSPLRVQHYVGTREAFDAKSDVGVRRTKKARNFRKKYHATNYDIKPWLEHFVRDVGVQKAKELLEPAGVVGNWKHPHDVQR